MVSPVGADIADQLSRLARSLEHEHDLQATLDGIVHAAVDTVPGAQHASISVIQHRREVRTQASTGELSNAVDVAQYETGQGPCLDTLYEKDTERLENLQTDPRWPAFTARARELGVGSMLSVQLYVEGDDLGALNLVNTEPYGFDEEDEPVALLFASHAAVAMAGAQAQAELRTGMRTRDIIGQAKGILMERFSITADQAFALLVRVSQSTNRKLADIAEELTTSRQLPPH